MPSLLSCLFLLLGRVQELVCRILNLKVRHKVQHHYCAMYLKQTALFPFCFHIFHILSQWCLSMACVVQNLVHPEVLMQIAQFHLWKRTTCCGYSFCNSIEEEGIPKYVLLRCTMGVCLLLSPKIYYAVVHRNSPRFQQLVLLCLLIYRENRKTLFLQAKEVYVVISNIMDIDVLSFQS